MPFREVTLKEVLENREKRVLLQEALLEQYHVPVLSCTMNIPGEVKQTPLIDFIFRQSMESVRNTWAGKVLREVQMDAVTGPEAFFAVDSDAEEIKNSAVSIESLAPIGRLLDLDVIGTDGRKLSRLEQRTCLVCGGPVTACSRSRAHGLESVKNAAWAIMTSYGAERLGDLAVAALIREARLTPKPGLVDENNTGSHRDMDLPMLLDSATALKPYFRFCAAFGLRKGQDINELICAGLEAENTMLGVTGGINTHKGAIYALGLFLASLGAFLMDGEDPFVLSARFAAEQAVWAPQSRDSHGGIVAARYQAGGAREEAMEGFPTARKGAQSLKESGGDGLYALLRILEDIRDTNLLYRGGPEGMAYVHASASAILEMDQDKRKDALLEMDRECIRLNISPGGAADMLALACLIESVVPQLL